MGLIKLFFVFCQISVLSFGGGYGALSLIQNIIVNEYSWLTQKEFIDLVTISQMTPGPIFINAATFVGAKLYGVLGGIIATLGAVVPSFILVAILGYIWFKYKNSNYISKPITMIQSVIVSLLLVATIQIVGTVILNSEFYGNIDFIGIVIGLIAFAVIKKTKINPIIIIFGSGLIGIIAFGLIG